MFLILGIDEWDLVWIFGDFCESMGIQEDVLFECALW